MRDAGRRPKHTAISSAVPLTLPRDATRVLLIHPPIYDIRVPWVRYVQPIRLLRLATFFRNVSADVQLIDAVAPVGSKPLRRVLARHLDIEDQRVNVWRFGISPAAIERALRALRRDQWLPDVIYVECATTFWWEGAREVIKTAKTIFPTSRVVLIGAYAELAPEHARCHTQADDIGLLDWSNLARLAPDLSHYDTKPESIYLSLADGTRPATEVVEEIINLCTQYNVQSFAFLDHDITTHHLDAFSAVLEAVFTMPIS